MGQVIRFDISRPLLENLASESRDFNGKLFDHKLAQACEDYGIKKEDAISQMEASTEYLFTKFEGGYMVSKKESVASVEESPAAPSEGEVTS